MFGLDNALAGASDGTTLLVVARHRAPPRPPARHRPGPPRGGDDAGRRRRARRRAARARVGSSATARRCLPSGSRSSSTARTCRRPSRRERRPRSARSSSGSRCRCSCAGIEELSVRTGHPKRTRTRAGAFAIGLVHGTGGSAGVGVLLLAAIPGHGLAVASLGLFAVATAVSMTLLSGGFGRTVGARRSPGSRRCSARPVSPSASGTRSARSTSLRMSSGAREEAEFEDRLPSVRHLAFRTRRQISSRAARDALRPHRRLGRQVRWTEGGLRGAVARSSSRPAPDGTSGRCDAAGTNARTRVHEYGGGASWCHGDDRLLLRTSPTAPVPAWTAGAEPRPITPEPRRAARAALRRRPRHARRLD